MELVLPGKKTVNVSSAFDKHVVPDAPTFLSELEKVNHKLRDEDLAGKLEKGPVTFMFSATNLLGKVLEEVKRQYELVGHDVAISYDPDDDMDFGYHFCRPTYKLKISLTEHKSCRCNKCI